MAAKKPKKKEPEKKAEEKKAEPETPLKKMLGNIPIGVIKTTIIASTFISIAALSIFTQGLDDEWPGAKVVAIRLALLSGLALIYFLMLYFTSQKIISLAIPFFHHKTLNLYLLDY